MPRPLQRLLRRLRRDRTGVALTEFAFGLPLVLGVGCYGLEATNLALANLRISQAALNLADNAARVGSLQSDNSSQLREIDVNDVLVALRLQTNYLELTTKGRVTLSSLEEHDGKQYIHWQRCLGTMKGADWDSHYGKTSTTAGTKTGTAYAGTVVTGGMGPTGSKVVAPKDSGVMFVEVNYTYTPLFTDWWLGDAQTRVHYVASFIVRDKRVFDQIYNPSPEAQRYTCDKYTAA